MRKTLKVLFKLIKNELKKLLRNKKTVTVENNTITVELNFIFNSKD